MRFTYVPILDALLALNEGNPDRAIDFLTTTAPYDLAESGTWFGRFGNMYPVYVRAQAFLASRKGVQATGQFQKILDNPGLVGSDAVGPLARLGLARGLAQLGDGAKARDAYEKLLKVWAGADRDLPALKQLKAEYAKVSSGSAMF